MRSETHEGIMRLLVIIVAAVGFLCLVSLSITLSIMAAEYIDSAKGWLWSMIFWVGLFGSIIGTTYLVKYFISLFGDNFHIRD